MAIFQKIVSCFAVVLFSVVCHAQYYNWGAEPPTVFWKQIKTDNFQVIYPSGFDSVAKEFTKKLEFVYASCSKGLRTQPKKISVVLHNQSNIGNASVGWCPSQMDVFSITPQDMHSQEWYEHLAIHEFRHVVQMNALNQGITKILYFLLGEQAIGAVLGLYIPTWLLEGDAVCTETAFSTEGRGRQADFSMGLRAQTYEKGIYSYSKAYFGSYRDYVPNHYELGYFLLANSRLLYGQHLEADIFERAATHPFSIRPTNRAILNKTNLPRRIWYQSVFQYQADEWKLKHDREIQTPYDTIICGDGVYTNYINGIQHNDSVYFAERSALDRIPQLVKIQNGKQKVIANIAFKPSEDRIHSNGKTIVWQETNYNVRWELKQSSRIYMYDIDKHKKRKFKTERHVFSPAISPSDERIAVAEIEEDGSYFLTIYDKASKQIIRQIPSPDHDVIQQPSWNENGSKIVFVGLNSAGKRIVEYDVAENAFTEILPYTKEDLSRPQYWHDYVLYTSSYSGVDNIFAIHRDTKQISRITVGDFGSKFPSVQDSTLVYSNYNSDGYQLAKIQLNPAKWHDLKVVKKETNSRAQMLTNQEGGVLDFSTMSDTTYATKNYIPFLHLINIHSWMPFYLTYSSGTIEEKGNGFQVISQNHLGTTFSSAGYKWNSTAGTHNFFTKVTYKGLFPVFEFEYDYGTLDNRDTITLANTSRTRFVDTRYRTNDIFARVYLPFNFSSKSYTRQVVLLNQWQKAAYHRMDCPDDMKQFYRENFSLDLMTYQFIVSNMRSKARQEINPRWGQLLNISYSYSPKAGSDARLGYETNEYAELSLYFPGLQTNHSLNLYVGAEYNEVPENQQREFYSILKNHIKSPRGFIDTLAIPTNEYLCSFQANYTFPMFYPDWEWGDFLYLKRIRCNAFVDYARVNGDKEYLSGGAELLADFHLCNFIAPISAGVRISRLAEPKYSIMELLFTTNFKDI